MIRAALALLLACVVCAAEADLPPHRGTVVAVDRTFADVWIFSETVDGVTCTLDGDKSSPAAPFPRAKIKRIEYARHEEPSWFKGDTAAQAKPPDWLTAAAQFQECAKTVRSWYTRHSALLRAADAWIRAKKPDEAGKALDELISSFPKTAAQARVAGMRAEILELKNDKAGALKAFRDIAGRTEWGVDAMALGSIGQGRILAADGKAAEAGTILAAAFAKLDSTRDADWFGQVGGQLVQQQLAAGQNDPAIDTLRRLSYGANDPTVRAQSQLQWAQVLMKSPDATSQFQAFDHAAIAMGSRTIVADKAAALAAQIGGVIDHLPPDQASNELKAEYRRYLLQR